MNTPNNIAMKNLLGVILILVVFVTCNTKSNSQNSNELKSASVQTGIDQGEPKGKILMDANDCKTCHHKTNKIIGPAHLDVAKKYETTDENVKMLAGRIIKGSSGVWGDIPMNEHSGLSQTDAEEIVRYILSLDDNQPH